MGRHVPRFVRLNLDWNADPNAPEPEVSVSGQTVSVSFHISWGWGTKDSPPEDARLTFYDCRKWRLGGTNDEGWFRGQCRYSRIAPQWGEFYELIGEDTLMPPIDWRYLDPAGSGDRHFLFYFRDNTFECVASRWELERWIIDKTS